MNYFKAEMVNEMFSDGIDQEAVDLRWQEVCDQYDDHLAKIEERLPQAARNLASKVGLHGGRVLHHAPADGGYDFTVRLSDQDMGELLCVLEYELESYGWCQTLHEGDGFVVGEARWLYDEWDITDDGVFVHRILLTTGLEVELTFKTMAATWAKIEDM